MTASALDTVPGLGEVRRKALVTHFGSVARLRQATAAEIAEVPGIGAATAAAVLQALGAEQTPADPATWPASADAVGDDARQAL